MIRDYEGEDRKVIGRHSGVGCKGEEEELNTEEVEIRK